MFRIADWLKGARQYMTDMTDSVQEFREHVRTCWNLTLRHKKDGELHLRSVMQSLFQAIVMDELEGHCVPASPLGQMQDHILVNFSNDPLAGEEYLVADTKPATVVWKSVSTRDIPLPDRCQFVDLFDFIRSGSAIRDFTYVEVVSPLTPSKRYLIPFQDAVFFACNAPEENTKA